MSEEMQIFLTNSIVAADDGIDVGKKMPVEMCKFSLPIDDKLTLDIFWIFFTKKY